MVPLYTRPRSVGRSHQFRSQPRRLLCVCLALASVQLVCATAADARRLAIKEPRPGSTVSGSVPFSATATERPRSVSFHVDGKRRWTDRSRPFAFGRRGVIDLSSLSPGLHHLAVEARYRRGKRRRATVTVQIVRNSANLPIDDGPPGANVNLANAPPVVAPPVVPPPAGPGLLWRADFETGNLSQWEGVNQYTPGRASVVTSPRIQGSYAARIEVREGEFIGSDAPSRNRTQLGLSPLANRHNPQEGDDWWYSWWFYLPSTTPVPADGDPGYMILSSWATKELSSAPEVVGHLEIRDTVVGGDPGPGYTTLHYEDGGSRADGHKYFWRKRATDVTRDAWHKMLIHRKWSSTEAVGFVEIWYDDVQQILQTDAAGNTGTRAYHRTLKAGHSARMHQGIYRTNSIGGTAVIYLDGLRIGTTRESVDN